MDVLLLTVRNEYSGIGVPSDQIIRCNSVCLNYHDYLSGSLGQKDGFYERGGQVMAKGNGDSPGDCISGELFSALKPNCIIGENLFQRNEMSRLCTTEFMAVECSLKGVAPDVRGERVFCTGLC
jgi:hypothetical protein